MPFCPLAAKGIQTGAMHSCRLWGRWSRAGWGPPSFGSRTSGDGSKKRFPLRSSNKQMNRSEMLRRVQTHPQAWDMIVVGGGATGVGVAIDAAARGYDVLLMEQSDFGKGTSSRSTKLVHGGERYLEQGNGSLVIRALKERGLVVRNAPHLLRELGF